MQRSIPTQWKKDASPCVTFVGEQWGGQWEEAPRNPRSLAGGWPGPQGLKKQTKIPSPCSPAGSPGLLAATKTAALPPQPQPWKWRGDKRPQSPSPPRMEDPQTEAAPSGRVSCPHCPWVSATALSCSSPPGKHFHCLITPEAPPWSLPQQIRLELHIFSHPLNKQWLIHIHSRCSPIHLFIQLFTLASSHPCNHSKLTIGETKPACCPANGHGPLDLLQ